MIKYVATMLASVIIASLSQMLLKKSANKKYENIIKEYLNPYVIIGYGMMFLATFCSIYAFKGLEYMFGTIIQSLEYVLILFMSRVFFGEKITSNKMLGNVFIVVGVLIYCL